MIKIEKRSDIKNIDDKRVLGRMLEQYRTECNGCGAPMSDVRVMPEHYCCEDCSGEIYMCSSCFSDFVVEVFTKRDF